ncbi:MAG: hypothetical protein QT08_C0009G0024 [archaeon GW2011_AR17]|nr:MAG: hypothetical protein QT08_C0009G0024 [archaeon GW2011_AR17]MBS3154183.1 hypothetical protein [Candidatus Woesearchaeota archaeon]HIH14780.1 hypothetical protein [Nanoarchaeota archaeon]HIH58668.1 hypothetical protein [Nanoarchaeota archaeon]HII14457.1 hypothetical protein [Nanoarchaeota archaeon]
MGTIGKILSEKVVYQNMFFTVLQREIQTSLGEGRTYLLWDRRDKSFSVVVALTSDQKVIFLSQPKYAQFRHYLTLPIGTLFEDEGHLEAAKRTFLREAGYESDEWLTLRESGIIDFPVKLLEMNIISFYIIMLEKFLKLKNALY